MEDDDDDLSNEEDGDSFNVYQHTPSTKRNKPPNNKDSRGNGNFKPLDNVARKHESNINLSNVNKSKGMANKTAITITGTIPCKRKLLEMLENDLDQQAEAIVLADGEESVN